MKVRLDAIWPWTRPQFAREQTSRERTARGRAQLASDL